MLELGHLFVQFLTKPRLFWAGTGRLVIDWVVYLNLITVNGICVCMYVRGIVQPIRITNDLQTSVAVGFHLFPSSLPVVPRYSQ
jgi:hypothetical protein